MTYFYALYLASCLHWYNGSYFLFFFYLHLAVVQITTVVMIVSLRFM